MAVDVEQVVRDAYAVAERQDVAGWVSVFTDDGVFIDESIGVTYKGPDELGKTVEVYATAFPDMHRELYDFWVDGNTVIVRLALQGTHTGPLATAFGVLPPTGKRMDAPCADIWEIEDGKVKKFDCYPEGTIIFAQLGILSNLEAAFTPADHQP
ncbi:MAG TPA: nuclear transport factor 2 family protein [Kribbella sp.]|uniref:nuclear transport factor 2 family protein n=1 Tax=Kribbella sp. TaxID=1871183 RepID=UPI002D765079|nr:nuclear transport factor 2 family protein [Kribbella sp.]HET6294268.1 nuclear transport factor 2 family protein [Kribbella sp.]